MRNYKKKSKIIYVRIILVVIFLIAIFCLIKFVIRPDVSSDMLDSNSSNLQIAETSTDVGSKNVSNREPITFSLAAIGDVMCHNTQYMDAYNSNTNSYDFSYVFEDIQTYIESADISIGSLETTFAGKDRGYSNYPTFNSPEELAYDLSELGYRALDIGHVDIEYEWFLQKATEKVKISGKYTSEAGVETW